MSPRARKPKSFGDHLRAQRLGAELSQSELSTRCGISKPTLSRYENDHVLPSLVTLRRLADALGIELSDLVGNGRNGLQLLVDELKRRDIQVHSQREAEHMVDLIADDLDAEQARKKQA